MKRIVRTGASALPPSADAYRHELQPPVVKTHPPGSLLKIRTFCGVEIICTVTGVRGQVYDVRPAGDPMINEFQKAGVPITPSNARDQFVAFEWQIVGKHHI